MVERRTCAARRVARAHLSVSRWTGSSIGLAAVVRFGTGVMSLFAVGPLSGVAAYPLWFLWGNAPIVTEWLLAGLLVVAGIVTTRARLIRSHRRALIVGWFVVVDTVVYSASITVVLAAKIAFAGTLWWRLLTAVVLINLLLLAMGVVVIRKACSVSRIQHHLLRGRYVRKPRVNREDLAW